MNKYQVIMYMTYYCSSKIILCESEYCDLFPLDYIVYDAVIMTCAGVDGGHDLSNQSLITVATTVLPILVTLM